jgi:tellurite resistance protein
VTAPVFPPRQSAAFAKTPPAIFPPILGLLGLAIALRLALAATGLPPALGELVAGAALGLWAFATAAYAVKIARRPGVVAEDLRGLPGRSGLAAMTMGGMAGATLLAGYGPVVAKVMIVLALTGHAVLALLLVRLLLALPPEARKVNPTAHLSFVGFIVAAPASVAVGWTGLAMALLLVTLPVAGAIWASSAVAFSRAVPPPPLRPLLAIHAAPAALMATVTGMLGYGALSAVFLSLGIAVAVALLASVRWLTSAGVSPMWGAFTFPLAALAGAALRGGWLWPGLALTAGALVVVPPILWWVLQRWPGGRLAAMTNAAEA